MNVENDCINKRDVLDKGYVKLIDILGSDKRIIETAIASYGFKIKNERDEQEFINMLVENDHLSPFEHVVLTFRVKLPIFVARQIIRHRTASVNELSARYTVLEDEFYVPDEKRILNSFGTCSEQSLETYEEKIDYTKHIINYSSEENFISYHKLLDKKMSNELSRVVLPVNTYTEWYWTIDLRNLFNFFKLRLDKHAQYEVREYAKAKLELARSVLPKSISAFENKKLNSKSISFNERIVIKELLEALRDNKIEDFSNYNDFIIVLQNSQHADIINNFTEVDFKRLLSKIYKL